MAARRRPRRSIAWIGGLDDAPADATEGALEVARRLAAVPPELGTGDLGRAARRGARGGAPHLRVQRPRLPRLHPGWRALHRRAGGVPRAGAEPLRRAVAAEPGDRAARGERDAVALRTVRVPRGDVAGRAHDRGVAGEPLGGRDGAAHAKLGEDFLDGTYYVTDQAHGSNTKAAMIAGFGARNVRRSCRPTTSSGWTRRRSCAMVRGGSRGRAASVPGDRRGGHDEHRRGRSARRDRRRRRARGSVVPRRRRLRRVLPADRPRAGARSAGPSVPTAITLDPHKGLFLPYGTGGLIVRDREAMRDAHFEGAAYLQDLPPRGSCRTTTS